jgi:putative N6-adenine-specific DNA methylase
MDTFFAVTAPGLEPFAAAELGRLGLLETASGTGGITTGGVLFEGGLHAAYAANLHLRTASRVLLRLGEFRAVSFAELRKKAARLPWERCLAPGQPLSLHVTCHKSKLYHSDAVAERIAGAIADRLEKPAQLLKSEDDADAPAQLVVVRMANDICTVSADTSGALLHRRGYRLALAKAPLRETLAAGLLLAADWDGSAPLLDPFCGSGTIPIEAALLARGTPPGLGRRFAFMSWPTFDATGWQALCAALPPVKATGLPVIQASDRDAGAVEMAQANAARAGVADCIQFSRRAVSDIQPPDGPGWVVTNPPYGVRASPDKDLRNLYARLGDVLRRGCPGWHFAMLCSDPALVRQTRLNVETSLPLVNGGLPVRLSIGRIG